LGRYQRKTFFPTKYLILKGDKRVYLSERYRDEFNKMRSQIGNISGKIDALAESRQETKDEGKFSKLTHRLNGLETVN